MAKGKRRKKREEKESEKAFREIDNEYKWREAQYFYRLTDEEIEALNTPQKEK